MKICVLNLSGNVGKSTLAVHLLAACTTAARIVSVESINSSAASQVQGLDVEELSASCFKEIFREIMMGEEVIVDVGASNVAAFMSEMKRFRSAVGEFDLVLVPTVPADKQQRDTIATVDWLHSLGLDEHKVRVVFNQYATDASEPMEVVFAQVVGYGRTDGRGKAVFEPYAVVDRNEAYEMAEECGRTVRELAEDTTDWKAARLEAKCAGDMEALERAMAGQMAHDLAVTAQQNLARVHALLLPQRAACPDARDSARASEAIAARKRA
ncbi:StbB family protein [Variovorax sp. J22R133]|uniref:StbB family protein n=1 Tax=Variovorax brevis TaxID=3053503 RepID=UPI0025763DB4|nr:StbB family protein [Variovorax sp. J22R133]MDM0116786.1 StbB family protein [Variovorax sp. J22R133]